MPHKSCGLFSAYQLIWAYFRIESDFCYDWVGKKKAAEPITAAGLEDSGWDRESRMVNVLFFLYFSFLTCEEAP